MKSILTLFILFFTLSPFAQDGSHNWTVQMWAEVNDDPASITLKWLPNALGGETFFIWKKEKGTVGWGTSMGSVAAGATLEFTDTDIFIGRSYEYMIQLRTGGSINAWGYINTGIQTTLNPNKGDLLLLVDERHADALADEIDILEYDMYTDGWMVTTVIVDSTSTPPEVKDQILAQYASLNHLVGLYILGHVAVPYSGDLYPDYLYYHRGAWPADVYYADMFGEWTDTDITRETAIDPRNDNVPGDGKFDQSIVPSQVTLQMSRVDFYNLNDFAESEEDLMRNYLNKAHEFKMAEYIPTERGLFDQGDLAYSLEGYSQSAIRNFTGFFGPDEVHELDYWTTLNSGDDYLWSYGSGDGTYSLANGLNGGSALTSDHMAVGFNESTFTMFYGNNFGDWDTPNNLLRSSIALGRTLTCSWAGRPNWHYQHMALGENIGYSAQASQDLYSDYFSLTVGGGAVVTYEGVHVAQLGDPTVRMYYVAPPGVVAAASDAENTIINWAASTDGTVDGYNVYRRLEAGLWTKVNSEIIEETTYTDMSVPDAGVYIYMVKAVKLKSNASGSFYNESHGRETTVEFFSGIAEQQPVELNVFPNPNDGNFQVIATQMIDALRVYSADGQLVYQAQPQALQMQIELSNLSHGIYVLEMDVNGETHVERLVVK
ncbi:MAG: T9SS type A sorting domain-containing protein [Crocinitomix sp.]|nr:T9SS type A sorting domain-containing protein [Crocinitomix sp.]